MAQKKKDGKMASFKINNSVLNKLENYSSESGLSKTRIVEDALKDYFKVKNI